MNSSYITGHKDTDLIILSKLDDKDLLNLCVTNKTIKNLCEIESFWMKRLEKNFPDFKNTSKTRNWKQTYLALVYYLNKYDPNKAMIKVAKKGDKDLVNFFIKKGADNWIFGMKGAARGGHRDLVEFFIQKGATWFNLGMEYAARGGHRDLVEFFIQKGAKEKSSGMRGAARGGHKDLVEFFIQKGA